MAESSSTKALEIPDKIPAMIESFESFEIKRTLIENPENRLFVVEGVFNTENSNDSPAIVVLEKTHFTEKEVSEILSSKTTVEGIFQNDVYGNFLCYPPVNVNAIKATVIHPATAKHISKFSAKVKVLIEETPEVYERVTLPHIRESQFDVQWVYNILEHKKEVDRIVFEDPDPVTGFILVPDLKWDCRTISNLYLTGIILQRDIKSLRDLTAAHLPLLNNLLVNGSVTILHQ